MVAGMSGARVTTCLLKKLYVVSRCGIPQTLKRFFKRLGCLYSRLREDDMAIKEVKCVRYSLCVILQ